MIQVLLFLFLLPNEKFKKTPRSVWGLGNGDKWLHTHCTDMHTCIYNTYEGNT